MSTEQQPPPAQGVPSAATPVPGPYRKSFYNGCWTIVGGDARGKYVASVQIYQTPRACGLIDEPMREATADLIIDALNQRAALQSQPALLNSIGKEGCHGLDTPERVCFYEQDFYVLSNFSSFQVALWGMTFQTSEHAYHWRKFSEANAFVAIKVLCAFSAHEALRIATRHRDDRRKDWDDVKVDIMREILAAKVAQHEYVRRKLLTTGTRELVENSWRDDFWGWGPNREGENMLGKLWMELRAALLAEHALLRDGKKDKP